MFEEAVEMWCHDESWICEGK